VVDAVVQAAAAGRRVKVAGAGHSTAAVGVTDGCLIDFGRYRRLLSVDRQAGTATVQAGIAMNELCPALAERDLALPVMGEAPSATVGGSLATSTHGTGGGLPGLAAYVTALELITAAGSVLTVSAAEEPQVFAVARVGLGALGVMSTVTVQCVPAFNLRTAERPARLDDVLGSLDSLVAQNDHFEFWWLPFTDWALTRQGNRTDEPIERATPMWSRASEVVLNELATFSRAYAERLPPVAVRGLAPAGAALMRGLDRAEYVARGYQVMMRPRMTRVVTMEYSLDAADAVDALGRLRATIADGGLAPALPIHVRFTASDGVALSPSFGRDTCHVAVHASPRAPYRLYFARAEAILDELGGRPHWGMLHSQTAATLAPKYPEWARFQAVRARLDPDGVFANDYLDRVLGPVAQTNGQG
jgi:FAD-linked oxidoreductase